MDFADAGSEAADYHLELALRQQASRSFLTPLPYCESCDDAQVHVTDKGVRFRYCGPCAYELTGRTV